ncbi:MAG: ATP-binding protein [Ferruginibacter sp.]
MPDTNKNSLTGVVDFDNKSYEKDVQYSDVKIYTEAILSAMQEPLLVLNIDFKKIFANNAFHEIFGLGQNESINLMLFELKKNKLQIQELDTVLLIMQASRIKELEWEVEFKIPVTNKRTMLLNASRVRTGIDEALILFAFKDITEIKNDLESRLLVEKNTEKLEGKINERTSMLEASNISLARSNKNLQEFASIASHDLQEPLRKIKTFTSILKDRFSEELPAAARELIAKTQQSANRMSVLIKDVLNYSRVAVPESNFIETDIAGIIKNVISDFDLLTEEKKAIIHVEEGIPIIKAVPLQINQLFYNLVGNSLKFASNKRLPVIDISWKKLSNEESISYPGLIPGRPYIQFSVKDNGIGFEQEFAEQIFSVFERLNTAKDYEGTGIGLALCRKILDNHHGIIMAEAAEERGSCFFIILPFEQ